MLLVADSGSTKADWKLADGHTDLEMFSTMGFNPFFHNEDLIASKINENTGLAAIAPQVTQVYFFGAGCSSPERNAIVENGLKKVFTNAMVHVEHDILAAALATCGDDKGISVIMGTGSNSCYWDGASLAQVVPALGYILGDEGSGSYYGKQLLSGFLYKTLPATFQTILAEEYHMSKEEIFDGVHNRPNPNVYLASFAKVLSNHKDHPWVREMVTKGTRKFIDIHLTRYPEFKSVPIHFVGSIAYHFSEIIMEVAASYGFTVGKIIKQPIHDLLKYYQNKLQPAV